MIRQLIFLLLLCASPWSYAEKQLLWGDTHLHTSNSFDAFLNGNHSVDPDTAYRFAKGQPVIHPYNRTRVQLNTPLDFLVVTDHAEFYGGIKDIYNMGIQDPDPNLIERIAYWFNERQIRDAIDSEQGPAYFADQLPHDVEPRTAAAAWTESIGQAIPGAALSLQNAWDRMRVSAEDHYQPGTFTTLIGWEWSSTPGGANLHRVVMTDASSKQAEQFLPFSSVDSPYPEDLWRWMEDTGKQINARFIAIPHNSNLSKGYMFADTNLKGDPIDAEYAARRIAAEPVAEMTQIKGDSETHPNLSPADTFADFEPYQHYLQQEATHQYIATPADYLRPALKSGLRLEQTLGVNPFQVGMIGATDSHTGLASAEEPNFWGKMAYDSVPERKQGNALAIGATGWTMQAAGLAGVWATENSREAILDAVKRREVYATTGPRMRVRFDAGYGDHSSPMGSELVSEEQSPVFSVTAQRDPKSANLDRIQIIKGWVDNTGATHEQVFNVAWSGERTVQADGHLPPVGDTVDRRTGRYTNNIGAAELSANWQDPEFDAGVSAFYYARVLQIPTPRHAMLDAIALGLEEPTEGPMVIQERAYTSPIWLKPQSN